MGELRVIGAGFGRTGTMSLRAALRELGFGPVCHGADIIIRPHHVMHWLEYHRTGATNWRRMYKRFGSAIDFPACCAWKELAAEFPDAKIILTVRDPQRWWKSTAQTIYPGPREQTPAWAIKLFPLTRWYIEFIEGIVWDGVFHGRFEDQEYAIKVFEQHIDDVIATADPDRLLVYDVKEGWEPLCAFLGVPVPSTPFPHVNDARHMKRWNRFVTAAYWSILPLAGGIATGFGWLVARRRRR